MSLIEGVGDEVTLTLAIIFVFTLILIAWASTGIRNIPFISVIIVHLTARRNRRQGQGDRGTQDEGHSQPQVRPRETTGQIISQASVGSPLYVNITVRERAQRQAAPGLSVEDGRERNEPPPTVTTGSNVEDRDSSARDSSQAADAVERESSVNSSSSTQEPSNLRPSNDSGADQSSSSDQRAESSSSETGSVAVPEHCPQSSGELLTETELRHRRVAFFSNSRKVSESTGVRTESNTSVSVDGSKDTHSPCLPGRSDSDPQLTAEQATRTSEPCATAEARDLGSDVGNDSFGDSGTREPDSRQEGEIRVRLKYLNDTQRLVTALPTETIGTFRRKHFSLELSESKLVRFIFNGQDLRNDRSTLESCNIIDNSVVHCLITQPRPQESPQNNSNNMEGVGFDIGNYVFPLFGLFLSIIWYLRFSYKQFFSVSSTLMLTGITFLFLALFFSMFRRTRGTNEIPD